MARWSTFDEAQYSFDQFIEFFKEIYAPNSFRPIPPMLGNGQLVELKTLFLIVIGKGGYDAVSKNKLWNLVAERSGLNVSISSSVKLIYSKYLGSLETWLIKVSEGMVLGCSLIDDGINCGWQLIELEAKIKKLLSDFIAQDTGDKIPQIHNLKNKYDFLDESKLYDSNGVKSEVHDGGFLGWDMPRNLCNIDDTVTLEKFDGIIAKKLVSALDVVGNSSNNNEVNNVPSRSNEGKGLGFDDDGVLILDPSNVNREKFGRKRKRKSMKEMLCWLTSIAKNPCDPKVCSIPEISKWSSQTTEETKKQVLLFREAAFMKRDFESSIQHEDPKGKKMRPRICDDDQPKTACNLKGRLTCGSRRRFSNEKSISVVGPVTSKVAVGTEGDDSKKKNTRSPQIDEDLSEKTALPLALEKNSKKAIPIGPIHQAKVPEWTGMASESDPKWLGTQIWQRSANRRISSIERDQIGKGRDDFCNCQVPGSVECVKSHIAENREKVKLELGGAFYQWNFDKVGEEEVSRHWTYEEERKFKVALKSNLSSHKKSYWDRVFSSFPSKKPEDLVSYYFNVFVLRRRRFQNRHSPNDIVDSDDDGLETEPLIKPKAIDSVASKNSKNLRSVSKGRAAKP